MDRGEFNKDVDLIAGFTQVEGHMLLNIVFPAANNPEMNMTEFKEIVSMALPAFTSRNDKTEEIVEAATHVYVKNTDDDHNLPYILAKMCGDALITHTTYMTAMKFAALSAQRTFLYDFHLRPFFSTKPKFITADHGDDLFFTFGLTKLADALGIPCAIGQEKTEYIRQEDMVIQLWTSFAKTGIPSADGAPTWLELEEGGAFMKIAQHPELLHNYEEEQMKFWLETVPAIYAAEKRDEL
ncbi:hypothetical protein CAPTEDRAFT_223593 [Capitella teleta]|uniref:Carboxylesterase type B domain-containing protein n=1 Tax=Capitella teleta TaxID=283909 RepID=R7TVA4_CAPTE|nr:hypothetical protein CAPTEDRAFT_223593 [Capitella teleta]|eukprot:ELT97654.1 hypothetical protein CAPTEDRAFT_223593 [Capitella teleta]